MARSFAVIPLLIVFGLNSFGEEPKPKDKKPSQKMEIQVFRAPPNLISTPDLLDKTGKRIYAKGIDEGTFDVRKFLEAAGVNFPPGSEAIYVPDGSLMYVRNTERNLDLITEILVATDAGIPTMVDAEFSAIECSLPAEKVLPSSERLAFLELQHLAGKSMRLLDRVSVLTRSGQQSVVNHMVSPVVKPPVATGGPQDSFQTPFAAGESGTKASFEPVISPNGSDIDVNMVYRFQQSADANKGGAASVVDFNSSFTASDDFPLVLNVSPVPGQEGKFVVIVAHLRLINATGWKLKDMYEAEKQNYEAAKRRSK